MSAICKERCNERKVVRALAAAAEVVLFSGCGIHKRLRHRGHPPVVRHTAFRPADERPRVER